MILWLVNLSNFQKKLRRTVFIVSGFSNSSMIRCSKMKILKGNWLKTLLLRCLIFIKSIYLNAKTTEIVDNLWSFFNGYLKL